MTITATGYPQSRTSAKSPAADRLPADAKMNHSAVPHSSGLLLDNLEVRYGAHTAVKDISFTVPPGKTTALIGPSGCGKTTILKTVAGLTPIASGRIELNGRDITTISPDQRKIGLVPQSYAIFPHMSVRKNIAYGLRARRFERALINKTVDDLLDLTQLAPFANRMPMELSGGQRQRVALSRALAIKPELLLLDEPLSALDPQLRGDLRRQLVSIIDEASCGTLMVTHDQHEALSMAHYIAVVKDGSLVQLGTPQELWERPLNNFVADFLTSSMLLDIHISDDHVRVFDGAWQIPLDMLRRVNDRRSPQMLIRPDSLQISDSTDPAATEATVISVEYMGGQLQALIDLRGHRVLVNTCKVLASGDHVCVSPKPGATSLIGGNR